MSIPVNILKTENLTCGYKHRSKNYRVLENVSIGLKRGRLTALLGSNGAGKSTLIRTLAGVQPSLEGSVLLRKKNINSLSNKEVAQLLSLVLTERVSVGNLTAFALVSLGRFPYTSWVGKLKPEDYSIIEGALEAVDMLGFADTHISELSDGERQKVMIARALAQDTEVIFLDEPTAHLDLPTRVELMHLLRRLTHEQDKSILLSSHDLDSALRLSDELWVIDKHRKIHQGIPEDLVLSGDIERAFQQHELTFDYHFGSFRKPLKSSQSKVSLEGPSTICIWLRNALERNGYQIIEENVSKTHIRAVEELPGYSFQINDLNKSIKSIEQLLIQLKQYEETIS